MDLFSYRRQRYYRNLPALYVPDANISMISVQRLCRYRYIFVMFLKYEAIGIKLNTEIITYLNKITHVAKLQNLELIESYVNSENFHEIGKTL